MTPIDHEAWKLWSEAAVRNKWDDMPTNAHVLACAYLDLVAQLEQLKADKRQAVGLLRAVLHNRTGGVMDDINSFLAFLAERGEV